ncbi:hypothetical protein Pcinc_027640 [Petrolisthes cinctipes]|uniref:Reverse transcriptase RNase H-like domain-containing protein n=1 Tax=Petrolisthes cinctipes TaxID=88211 RepID=A0AAE1F424_PETCI|nr:hypothetical protein Pcinc_027640 [Petrolisthes cinctipes]
MAFFDPKLPTMLQIDAARTQGLGFVLLQKHGDYWRMVQCGSRFISDTESRYATIEMELTACVWACQKCRIFLAGLPHFDLIVDHRPLVTILNHKLLSEIKNPCLLRMCEKLIPYSFTVSWQKGAAHQIPDSLSRSPVCEAVPDRDADGVKADFVHETVIAALETSCTAEDGLPLAQVVDPGLEKVYAAASQDPEYSSLKHAIIQGFPDHHHQLHYVIQPYWDVRHMLALDDDMIVYGARLVIPTSLHKEIVGCLHEGN